LKQIFIYLFNATEIKKACEENLENKNHFLLTSAIIIGILLYNQNVIPLAKGQGGNAYFTKVEYPESKIYPANNDWWEFPVNLTIRNEDCTVGDSSRAWFFFKVYKDDELWWNEYNDTTYRTWWCDSESKVQRHYRFPIATWQGPNVYSFKIELYWDKSGTPYLLDVICLSVTCVLVVNLSYAAVFSYFFIYSLAVFLLLFYLLTTRPYQFWT